MGGRNPENQTEASSLVAHVESLFMPWDINALVNGFTEDCIIRFGILPEFRGQDALRIFFTERMSRQKGYKLRKQFRSLMGNIITNVWDGEWEDTATGLRMRGFGVEAWTMRNGKIAVWEAAFNVGPAGKAADLASIIG